MATICSDACLLYSVTFCESRDGVCCNLLVMITLTFLCMVLVAKVYCSLLHIVLFWTGIDRPQPGFKPSERIQETGRRLAKLAKELKVPFEYHAIAEKWEAISPAHLFLKDDEVLVVNCMFRFRHVLDETVTAASPRDLVLSRIRSMNPKVFPVAVLQLYLYSYLPFFSKLRIVVSFLLGQVRGSFQSHITHPSFLHQFEFTLLLSALLKYGLVCRILSSFCTSCFFSVLYFYFH